MTVPPLVLQATAYISLFMPPSLKGPRGASSNRIARPSVRNSVPLTNKVQYLKFGWSYSNQTLTVSSSIGSLHFTDITYPWGWAGSKCRTLIFLPYLDFVAAGGICVLQTRLVVLHSIIIYV